MKNLHSTLGYYVYTTYITLKDGRRIYAKDYGLKAFRIWIESKTA